MLGLYRVVVMQRGTVDFVLESGVVDVGDAGRSCPSLLLLKCLLFRIWRLRFETKNTRLDQFWMAVRFGGRSSISGSFLELCGRKARAFLSVALRFQIKHSIVYASHIL